MYEAIDSISFKKLLGYSIEGEEAAKNVYMELSDKMSGLVADRFKQLAEDEGLHKKELLKLHESEFGSRNYEVPEGEDLPPHEGELIEIEDVQNLVDAINKSMTAENNAYELYNKLAERNEEHSALFEYIAIMEKGHYESLKAERSLYEKQSEKPHEKHIPGFHELTMGSQG